ncbi:hypothetical protein ASPZODRAFT_138437 [Penicilliopsis zonata CBS 506.65]|uniref:Protein-lysine N-methyltransferase EFM4 n=1 Tax=Penicilliopsis zonata CBS 506.65 TaxID=1073090 RepID=A0A1L9SW21_9EURO|nr:hypothetical protein ASPZODRAFT_138437 [Penicilliopsis zonata CBS 506.65]OJJ51334.1 hypothetical protein ASPZODRAFT_138437 [Penicilliopsis zonata CBS 506.65]
MTHPTHLSPSELGTKEYWESFYERSLSHLKCEHEDEHGDSDSDSDDSFDDDLGTSWFSEHRAPEKVMGYLTSTGFPLSSNSTATVLDLGTGNGSMLALLRKHFSGTMVGVDYSAQSVMLARQLHADKNIRFEEFDLLSSSPSSSSSSSSEHPPWFVEGGFDIVLDKGTFDAISLCEEVRAGKRVCELYPLLTSGLVRRGGFLVVTSCNWTEEELIKWFTGVNTDADAGETPLFSVFGRVAYPRFRFGGQEGQAQTSACALVPLLDSSIVPDKPTMADGKTLVNYYPDDECVFFF